MGRFFVVSRDAVPVVGDDIGAEGDAGAGFARAEAFSNDVCGRERRAVATATSEAMTQPRTSSRVQPPNVTADV